MIAVILALFVLFFPISDRFAYDVASRCSGEASFAIAPCACTVKNRLNAGWAQNKVLNHYYATSVRPTQEAVVITEKVLRGEEYCDGRLYFMFSTSDVKKLGLQNIEPLLSVKSGQRQVLFYGKYIFKKK